MEEQEKMTYGQKAVGVNFNQSQKVNVAVTKQSYADIIDDLNLTREESADPEVKRLCSIAITEAQTAQMWAVKALTWSE